MRLDVYPTHRLVGFAPARPRQHREERGATKSHRRRSRHREHAGRHTRSRSRRPAPRRCGTTSCVTASGIRRRVRELERRFGGRADARLAPARSRNSRYSIRRRPRRPTEPTPTGTSRFSTGPRAPQRRSTDGHRLGQSARATPPRVAVPPGAAPRVKLAPDIAYDTPNPGRPARTYDDAFVFNGALDRYDWKLVGKKEMYVPYNNYRLLYNKPAGLTKAEPRQSRPRALGAASRVGGRRHAQARQAPHLQQAHVLPRRGQLGRARCRPIRCAWPTVPRELCVQSRATTCRRPIDTTFAIYDFTSAPTASGAVRRV